MVCTVCLYSLERHSIEVCACKGKVWGCPMGVHGLIYSLFFVICVVPPSSSMYWPWITFTDQHQVTTMSADTVLQLLFLFQCQGFVLTHWGWDKMAVISQTFSYAFSWMKISLKCVSEAPINNIPALVQKMAWRWSGNKPLSEPMIVDYRGIYPSLGLNEFTLDPL